MVRDEVREFKIPILRALLISKRVRMYELAARTGISRTTLHRIVAGQRQATASEVNRIARALRVDGKWLDGQLRSEKAVLA